LIARLNYTLPLASCMEPFIRSLIITLKIKRNLTGVNEIVNKETKNACWAQILA
jgi:hypothetical protein